MEIFNSDIWLNARIKGIFLASKVVLETPPSAFGWWHPQDQATLVKHRAGFAAASESSGQFLD